MLAEEAQRAIEEPQVVMNCRLRDGNREMGIAGKLIAMVAFVYGMQRRQSRAEASSDGDSWRFDISGSACRRQ